MIERLAILATGTELILGEVTNTNASHFSQKLHDHGYNPHLHLTCGDSVNDIKACIEFALQHSDALIITGGLGPTKDDLTREAVASYLSVPLIYDETSMIKLLQFVKSKSLTLSTEQKQQALLPQTAIRLDNPNGSANGWLIKVQNKFIVALPGPPHECLPMLDTLLAEHIDFNKKSVMPSLSYRLLAAPESEVATLLNEHLGKYAAHIRYRTDYPYLDLKFPSPSSDVLQQYRPVLDKLLQSYRIIPKPMSSIEWLRGMITEKQLSFSIEDNATFGLFAGKLMHPSLYPNLNQSSIKLSIKLEGLNHHWQGISEMKNFLDLTLTLNELKHQVTIPLRQSARDPSHLAVELVAHEVVLFLSRCA